MRRHDLLQVDPRSWRAMLDARPDLDALPLVAGWASRGWPVIVRRPAAGDAAGAVPTALPLPPCHGKRRVGFTLAAGPGVAARPAVLLREAREAAPPAWQPTIARLLDLGEEVGTAPRVYGALLWEHVTGLAYVTERSDLDLLWAIPDPAAADTLVTGLRRLDAEGPVRLDGEAELPDGGAVNWREIALGPERGQDEVLVKAMHGVTARSVAGLFRMAPVP